MPEKKKPLLLPQFILADYRAKWREVMAAKQFKSCPAPRRCHLTKNSALVRLRPALVEDD